MRLTLFLIILLLTSCECAVNRAAFFPDREIIIKKLPGQAEEIFIFTRDGERLQAYLIGRSRKTKTILYFHGNAGNLSHRLDDAMRLAGTGCRVLLLSYRGYGKSTGSPSEKGVYTDAEAALEYAQEKLGCRPGDIIIYGRSLGTAAAVHAAMDRSIAGLILITPFTSAAEFAQEKNLSLFRGLAGDAFNSLSKINRIRAPLLVIHGDRDEVVPYILGVRLYNAYGGRKKFIKVPGGRHNDLQDTHPGIFWKGIESFIREL